MFGIETTLYQGFYFLCITKLYNVPHFAAIPAEPLIGAERSLPAGGYAIALFGAASSPDSMSFNYH
ncbi:MAG: hypothetical protein V7K92_15195 [Nostoc sp.]|uniref:hypothetical protein n=1 Tax=Nostoc sp. TaxID=1180 RepID=UPI002FF2DDC5